MDNILFASRCGAALDTDLLHGDGTDDTQALQAALDTALEKGHLRLVLDGPALISKPLRIHANTTIYCLDKGCGLFLADGSDCCMLRNAHWTLDTACVADENIAILGGTFNHNAKGQIHDHGDDLGDNPLTSWVIGFEFYGVKNLKICDVTMMNQRTFTMLLANWEHVIMQNIFIDLRDYMAGNNQDGLHFFGPGRDLTLRDIHGRSGDDFIALAPDEVDLKSSIEDVLIDGVTLLDADQGIRLLCRADGHLDRVTIRNVTGTFGGFGFYINPWFDSQGGHYGNILIENVCLQPIAPAYDYRPAYLFSLGGSIHNLQLKNIKMPASPYPIQPVIAGGRYNYDLPETEQQQTHIHHLNLQDWWIDDGATPWMVLVRSRVDCLTMSDIHVDASGGDLVNVVERGSIDTLLVRDAYAPNMRLTNGQPGFCGASNVITADSERK